MDIAGILKNLRLGNKVVLTFQSPLAREKFRVALYKAKKEEDKVLTDVLDEERETLRTEAFDTEITDLEFKPVTQFKARFWLEKKPSDDYEVEIETPE